MFSMQAKDEKCNYSSIRLREKEVLTSFENGIRIYYLWLN